MENKEKDIKQIVEAISNATEEKTDYMVAWLDGWECCKNALNICAASEKKEANV